MHKIQVLLADDHAIIRDGLKQILSDTEDLVVVGEAANGVEVMHLVREKKLGRTSARHLDARS
jgi:DNA-binding NarL/FixJ family response regulator